MKNKAFVLVGSIVGVVIAILCVCHIVDTRYKYGSGYDEYDDFDDFGEDY